MKQFIIAAFIIITTAFGANAQKANKIHTDTMSVKGTCNMCKARIEEAAYTKGVKRANWDKNTGKLTVTYNSEKTSKEQIARRIAAIGHDADTITAPETAYKSLPECCAYKTNTCNH
jgi:hypothetical protein